MSQEQDATIANALGRALRLHQQGDLLAAGKLYAEVLRLDPDNADALHLVGVMSYQVGRYGDAISYVSRAVEISDRAEFRNSLGLACHAVGRTVEAAVHLRRAVELKPDHTVAHYNLGNVYTQLGKIDEAVLSYECAVELKPDYADALCGLGNARSIRSRRDEAMDCFRRVLAVEPDHRGALNNLGNVYRDLGQLQEAMDCFRRALQTDPDFAAAHNNLANALKEQGRVVEAREAFERALAIGPNQPDIHSNLLVCEQYQSDVTPARLAEVHRQWNAKFGLPLQKHWSDFSGRNRDPHRPLRLGFVSRDFGRHPVGYFLVGFFEHIDSHAFSTTCYCDAVAGDDLTDRLQAAADHWIDSSGLSYGQLAQRIHNDGIDILFDLAGHTAGNRLLTFARRPAPIQATWMGYVGTTGLDAMDYLVADRFHVPAGNEQHFTESVLRLPNGYVCYDPPDYAPPVGPLPALQNGYVTFGSFSNPAKLTADVVSVWSRVLQGVPGARLRLIYRGFDDASTRDHFRKLFTARGVDPQRVVMQGKLPHHELLAAYNEVDIALDTFPYSGGLTTCEALWMGVPVVTAPGATFAGRHSLSHLSNVGLTETIADSPERYVDRAVATAGRLSQLADLRGRLRSQMAESPLCDGALFCRGLESALREAWRLWCGAR